MSDEEPRGGQFQSVHRRIGAMITARCPNIRLNEVTLAFAKRQNLAARVAEALKDLVAKCDRRELAQWAFLIPKKRTDSQPTDALRDNALL